MHLFTSPFINVGLVAYILQEVCG